MGLLVYYIKTTNFSLLYDRNKSSITSKSKPRFGQKQEVDDDELNREEIIGNEKETRPCVVKASISFALVKIFSVIYQN